MSIFVLGINHKTAPLAVRERLVFTPSQLPTALRELTRMESVAEAIIVSTCNRTEIWCAIDNGDNPIPAWLFAHRGLEDPAIHDCLVAHRGADALRHLFRVACGLDSLVLGEPQILGQLKQAFRDALDAGTVGPVLSRAFQHAFSVAKQVRTETGIGASPVSVASAVVTLARRIFSRFETHTALLVGAGDTVELAARHLRSHGIGRLIIANRSIDRALVLAERYDGYAIRLDALPTHLHEADIIISATASAEPVVTHAMVEAALAERRHRPVFIADVAVPRDVERTVAALDDIYLYTVDDLVEVVDEGLRSRRDAAGIADGIIDSAVEHFNGVLRELDAVGAIRALRDFGGRIRDEALAEAVRRLERGEPADAVAHWLAHTLTNRLMHDPTVRLRDAGFHGDHDALEVARKLFGTDE